MLETVLLIFELGSEDEKIVELWQFFRASFVGFKDEGVTRGVTFSHTLGVTQGVTLGLT